MRRYYASFIISRVKTKPCTPQTRIMSWDTNRGAGSVPQTNRDTLRRQVWVFLSCSATGDDEAAGACERRRPGDGKSQFK